MVPGWRHCRLHVHERQRQSILAPLPKGQVHRDRQKKGFVNIKYNLNLVITIVRHLKK